MMMIVGAALVVAYGVFVIVLIARGDTTDRGAMPRRQAITARTSEAAGALKRRVATLTRRFRTRPRLDDDALRRPLDAYEDALNAAVATVEGLKREFGTRASNHREFEEVAVQALVVAHTLRRLADAAGACADACEVAEASRSVGGAKGRGSSPQHALQAS